jgi:hypothetical protein
VSIREVLLASGRFHYNPPPNWPQPPEGWEPAVGWQPDPKWGRVPRGWDIWILDNGTGLRSLVRKTRRKTVYVLGFVIGSLLLLGLLSKISPTMDVICTIIFYLGCAFGASVVAEEKGYSRGLWFLIGCVPIVGIVASFLIPRKKVIG